jgi:hypothetical protein
MAYDPYQDVRREAPPPRTEPLDEGNIPRSPHTVGVVLVIAALLIGLGLIYLANSMPPPYAVHSQASGTTAPKASQN